jgi:hypothetical protein
MFLKSAFNMITRIHSRSAFLKRLGTVDIYSPVRITPSNYFRYLEGPSSTVIRGREFVIPIDTMIGEETQLISFSAVPTSGNFFVTYDGNDSALIAFDDTATEVQLALRDVAGLEGVTVSGNYTSGFTVTMSGIQSPLLLAPTQDSTPLNSTIQDVVVSHSLWSPIIKRGDKIIDTVYGNLAIDEIIEMVDIGGEIMGFRCRME